MRHEESSLQQACVRWFRLSYPEYSKLLIAIPNHAVLSGDASQRARQWKRLEAEGAVTGAADLVLFASALIDDNYYKACFFEIKTRSRKQSPEQIKFQEQVGWHSYEYVIIRDLDSFIKKVKEYM